MMRLPIEGGKANDPEILLRRVYLVSLCGVWVRQNRQYFLNSSLSGVVRLFFVVV